MINKLVFYNTKSFSIYWAKTKLLPFRKSAFIANPQFSVFNLKTISENYQEASAAWFGEYMATRMLKVKLEENNVNANNLENFEDFENNDDEGEFYPENDYQEEVDFRWILES